MKTTAEFEITKVDIIDASSVANIHYRIYYASHEWDRVTQIKLDHENLKNFTYEELRKRVRVEALKLIEKRAPIENNLRRIEKMIGQRRSF